MLGSCESEVLPGWQRPITGTRLLAPCCPASPVAHQAAPQAPAYLMRHPLLCACHVVPTTTDVEDLVAESREQSVPFAVRCCKWCQEPSRRCLSQPLL